MDLAVAILPDPQRSLGPGKSRTTAGWRRDRRKHTAGLWIDLLDAFVRKLIQVLAIEGSARMRGNLNGSCCVAGYRIERVQLVSRCKPDLLTIEGDAIDALDPWKGSVPRE